MGKIAWLGGVAAMLVAGAACAADLTVNGNAANGEKIFKNGKGTALPCFSCHGDKGQGNDDLGAPRLAGQGDFYILKELTDFAEGRRTPAGTGVVMPGFAKELSDQDKRDVAAYVHSLPTTNEPVSDMAALAKNPAVKIGVRYKGEEIAKFGITGGVSACASCHGYNGRGAAPIFPMIGHQRYVYLVNQLHNWRASEEDKKNPGPAFSPRANDPVVDGVGMMRAIASKLSDDDILNVATYLATAPVTTNGNHRIPAQD